MTARGVVLRPGLANNTCIPPIGESPAKAQLQKMRWAKVRAAKTAARLEAGCRASSRAKKNQCATVGRPRKFCERQSRFLDQAKYFAHSANRLHANVSTPASEKRRGLSDSGGDVCSSGFTAAVAHGLLALPPEEYPQNKKRNVFRSLISSSPHALVLLTVAFITVAIGSWSCAASVRFTKRRIYWTCVGKSARLYVAPFPRGSKFEAKEHPMQFRAPQVFSFLEPRGSTE